MRDEPQSIETDITEACEAVGAWAEENFGEEQPAYFLLRGFHEEHGELDTSVLKRAQGIDDSEKYAGEVGRDAERDAVGDMFIYLMDFCHRYDADMDEVQSMLDGDVERMTADAMRQASEHGPVGNVEMQTEFTLDGAYWELVESYFEGDAVEFEVGGCIDALAVFCDVRGFDIDVVIEETMDEVLDREWDADIDPDET